jgi:hypothetical protein
MSIQLSKKQIEALKVELAQYGLKITVARSTSKSVSLRSWKPETAGGRACKAAMLKWAKLPPIVGVSSYKIKDWRGKWISEGHPKFAKAKIYQARVAVDLRADSNNFVCNYR